MQRIFLSIFLTILTPFFAGAMDFGLRFRSNDQLAGKRTSLSVDDIQFKFDRNFMVGFFFNFYSGTMFGDICTVHTDDGNSFSVVASYMNDGSYKLGIAINEELHLMDNISLKLNPDKEDHIDFKLDKKAGMVTLSYNENELSVPFDLADATSATFLFGTNSQKGRNDAAPIDLRNIRVFTDGKNTNHWDLKYHDTPDSSIDLIGGIYARVVNPHWLIDDHSDWKHVYSGEFKENIQTAFNPETEDFYIVSDSKIISFSPLSGESSVMPVEGGRRIMAYSNHLMYDTISSELINYNLSRREIGRFDFKTKRWDTDVNGDDEETRHFNHAYAADGEYIYAFGGYGFYKYNNDFFKIDLKSGSIDEIRLDPEIMPMTSSSAAVVDGMFYLFGGKGNPSGRQELPSHYTYTLYAYDLASSKGGIVWELDSVSENFLPSQTMYYNKDEDSFYLASTAHGGELIRISRTEPKWNIASTPIDTSLDVHDFVFDLFRSNDGRHLYLVIDKRLDATTHEYGIYTITAPFLSDEIIIKNKTANTAEAQGKDKPSDWLYIMIIAGATISLFVAGWYLLRKKRNKSFKTTPIPDGTCVEYGKTPESECHDNDEDKDDKSKETVSADNDISSDTGNANEENPQSESFIDSLMLNTNSKDSHVHFDRSKPSISLLGAFCIIDRNGNDITSKFTSRLKNLLILLLLSCKESASGIKYQNIDELIWNDKDEKSAQNNRNVSMRKLRILLEEIGDISIVYDKGFFKIDTGDVTFDYGEIHKRIKEIEEGKTMTPEIVEEILELLLMGPLLPNTRYDWLDKYKANFSDSALTILNKLLKYEIGKDDSIAYRIAETISLHDPLSEEAMIAKCKILSKRKMYGIAKNVYHKFCSEYKDSLGEDYHISFSDICKMEF